MKEKSFCLKEKVGDVLVKFGGHAVGKCMIPGMYDPKIPDVLKSKETRLRDEK